MRLPRESCATALAFNREVVGTRIGQGPDAWAATVPMPTPHTRGGAAARAPPPRAAASPPGAAPRLGRRAEEMLSAFGA